MAVVLDTLVIVAAAYVIGSVPFAFLLSRRRGIDLRAVGSGNVGASNVLRTSGVRTAVLALLLDAAKGTLAVLVAERAGGTSATAAAAALASVAGHIYPVWLRFKGGKGVATAAGAFTLLTPTAMMIAGVVFVAVVTGTRFVSVGSMAAALILPIAIALTHAPGVVVAGSVLTAAMILYRHRSNLARLSAGTERRLGQRNQLASYK